MAPTKLDELSRHRFNSEEVARIRSLRAERKEDGKPAYSHNALAEMFSTKAGTISALVRNMSYYDPDYVPINDNPERSKVAAEKHALRLNKSEEAAAVRAEKAAAKEAVRAAKAAAKEAAEKVAAEKAAAKASKAEEDAKKAAETKTAA